MRNKPLLVGLLFFFCTSAWPQATVSNYKVFLATVSSGAKNLVTIRKFEQYGKTNYLAVDLNTMDTQILRSDKPMTTISWQKLYSDYANTPYIKALTFAKKQSFTLQDAGIIHGWPVEKGINLTVDLCPSHKPLDRTIFTSLISEFGKIEKPVPIALSITGRFLLDHTNDMEWLNSLEAKGAIDITWINHTYNHYYDPKMPLTENFLLKPGTNIDFEVLQTEIVLLEHQLLPSVFFRFPGLVSDNSVTNDIINYGLIPIGSDAWLAKGQKANAGSIVLIHGNGNEPVGVNDFIKLLQSEKQKVLDKQWLLYDLKESISEEFKE
ncbi:polysaccharide deacetylase [Flavobacterium lindanitolerans]|uniref:polysaccharide deacetylase family protein n=1 Tax=Flavobacterium lindanitolerans TaxID=428988 RepID=UPI0028084829|nr:polysaccharide deacetylase [Flavobacterium lindanitolerans]MDQ7960582.1 polysaccharide deacetylase [Flavobacterium lindanitolerans]